MQDEAYTTRSLTLFVSSHFMFNVLGKLQSEILSGDKREALSTITLYTRILRQACTLSNSKKNSLAEEGLFLDRYLQLEQNRFVELSMQYQIYGFELQTDLIEPFMIQPFVELAVLSSLGAQNNILNLSYDKAQNAIHIQSIMHNESAAEKLEDKCEIALHRLKFFNHSYTRTINESTLTQTINI